MLPSKVPFQIIHVLLEDEQRDDCTHPSPHHLQAGKAMEDDVLACSSLRFYSMPLEDWAMALD